MFSQDCADAVESDTMNSKKHHQNRILIMLASANQFTWQFNLKDHRQNCHCHENLEPCMFTDVSENAVY
jgi:hypothetical protein